MPRIAKHGIYNWEVKRLGALASGTIVGFSPTSTISAPVVIAPTGVAPAAPAPTTSSAPSSSDIFASLQAAVCNAYSTVFSGHTDITTIGYWVEAGSSSANLRAVCLGLRGVTNVRTGRGATTTPSDHNFWLNVRDQIAKLVPWEKYIASGSFSYRGIMRGNPTQPGYMTSIDLLLQDLQQVSMPRTTPAPGSITYSVAPSASITSAGIVQNPNTPSVPNLFRNSGGFSPPGPNTDFHDTPPEPPAFVPPDPSTQIVNTTPQDTPAPISSSPTMLESMPWLKPALAVALGAVAGVAAGRLIAR